MVAPLAAPSMLIPQPPMIEGPTLPYGQAMAQQFPAPPMPMMHDSKQPMMGGGAPTQNDATLEQMMRDLMNNQDIGQEVAPDPRFPKLPHTGHELLNPAYSTQNSFGNPAFGTVGNFPLNSQPISGFDGNTVDQLMPMPEIKMSQEEFAQEVLSRSTPSLFSKPFIPAGPLQPISQAPSNARFVTVPNDTKNCQVTDELIEAVLDEVRRKNDEVIRNLPECYKSDRKLMLRVVMIDPMQFEFAAKILQSDENFLRRLLKANPAILQFASSQALSDSNFMERAAYLSRDALKYTTAELRDNKPFMKKMITFDSRNYLFASQRLQAMQDIALIALADDGMLLKDAPGVIKSDVIAVKTAVISNQNAFEFAMNEARKNEEIWKISRKSPDRLQLPPRDEMEKILRKNYVIKKSQKNLGNVISNKAKLAGKSLLVSRNYVTKWQGGFWNTDSNQNELRLVTADSRNFYSSWKKDLKKYPNLITTIEKFFRKRGVSQDVIDNLMLTDLMLVKKKQMTLAFSLYYLRNSINAKLGPDFASVTSLVAISQKIGEKWNLSVAEVIFDSEIRVDPTYDNGHRKYVLWDLYYSNKRDEHPKIIFKIEDRNKEIFEIYGEVSGGKYRLADRIEIDLEEEIETK